MTNLITLTIPNDDHIALRAFGKALEEMALAHGAEPRKTIGELSYKLNIDTTDATAALERLRNAAEELQPEVDTTAQQVESLVSTAADFWKAQDPVKLEEMSNAGLDESGAPPTTDSTGTPWDERIHSTSKALNADGTWRLRRKPKDMDEAEWAALVESVKAELNECSGVPPEAYLTDDFVKPPVTLEDAVNASIEAAHAGIAQEFGKGIANAAFTGDHNEPPVTPPGDDFHTDADVVSEQTVAGIPPLPVPPPVVVAPPVPEVTTWDFPRLMTFLTERHGKIDVATVNTLLAQDGMLSVQELNAHPDKIGPFVARVKAHLGE